jgi:hypothetical protein
MGGGVRGPRQARGTNGVTKACAPGWKGDLHMGVIRTTLPGVGAVTGRGRMTWVVRREKRSAWAWPIVQASAQSCGYALETARRRAGAAEDV